MDSLTIPVIILHLYILVGDWLLHIYHLKRVLLGCRPLELYPEHCMDLHDRATLLPEDVLSSFLRGELVCHHQSGVWYSVFLDQFREQTYI